MYKWGGVEIMRSSEKAKHHNGVSILQHISKWSFKYCQPTKLGGKILHNIKVGLKHCSIFQCGWANVGPPSMFDSHGATDTKNSQHIDISRFTYLGFIP